MVFLYLFNSLFCTEDQFLAYCNFMLTEIFNVRQGSFLPHKSLLF